MYSTLNSNCFSDEWSYEKGCFQWLTFWQFEWKTSLEVLKMMTPTNNSHSQNSTHPVNQIPSKLIMSLLGSNHSLSCLPSIYCRRRVLKMTTLTKTTIWKVLACWFGGFLLCWDIGLASCLCFVALLSWCVLLICSVLRPWTWHSSVYLTGTKRRTHCRSGCSARWWPRLL